VLDLVAEARKADHGLDASDLHAVARLEAFCVAFSQLDSKQISGPSHFQAFVEQYVDAGWEEHLHFDTVLTNIFGISPKASEYLRKTHIKVVEKDREEEVSLEHHSFRWLAKAFKGYGPVGCLTDVVNLVYAMLRLPQPLEASEEAAISAVSELQKYLDQGQVDRLWIPTHLAHDAEADDSLVWLLLERVHRMRGTTLQVLIQLPAEAKFDEVETHLTEHHAANVRIFRDKDYMNGKAVGNVWLAGTAQNQSLCQHQVQLGGC